MCAYTHTRVHTQTLKQPYFTRAHKSIYLYFNDYSFIKPKSKLQIILLPQTYKQFHWKISQ